MSTLNQIKTEIDTLIESKRVLDNKLSLLEGQLDLAAIRELSDPEWLITVDDQIAEETPTINIK